MHDFVWLLYAELVTNLCRFCHVELYIDKAMPEALCLKYKRTKTEIYTNNTGNSAHSQLTGTQQRHIQSKVFSLKLPSSSNPELNLLSHQKDHTGSLGTPILYPFEA
jgi:hypothetical protein